MNYDKFINTHVISRTKFNSFLASAPNIKLIGYKTSML